MSDRDMKRLIGLWLIAVVLLYLAGMAFGLVPSEAQVCEPDKSSQHCPSYNIFFAFVVYALYQLNFYGALIAAVATGVIALLTNRIKKISEDQLSHARKTDRAYLWPGFGMNDEISPVEREWRMTVNNTGRTTGVIKATHYALISEEVFNTGRFTFQEFRGRENVIPPEMGVGFIDMGLAPFRVKGVPIIACGYIVYDDIFGREHKQGWKHRLSHDKGRSDSLPGCYTSYKPWEKSEDSP
jgi:hypothetical protein